VTTLLADVGGTNVRFALADALAPMPLLGDSILRYRVADFAGFSEAARQYLDDTGAQPTRGVFAFAGPVSGDEVHLTNHPWSTVLSRTRRDLALDGLRALNDFAAMSLALPLLGCDDVEAIGGPPMARVGAAADQTFAIVGPGTGLGVGGLLVRDGRIAVLETEGGHLGFAPASAEEIEILRHLATRFGRVSNERVLSGNGLLNLYRALGEISGEPIDEQIEPAAITRRAADRSDALCLRTVERFCELLGAASGDLVLGFGAWDGVCLTGGITAHLLPWLREEGFRRRFEDKGRYRARMVRVPTIAVLHPDAGLLGTAAQAVIDGGGDLVRRHASG